MTIAHHFVGIVVIPVDVRVSTGGEIEVAEPEDADRRPQYVCQVCWTPLNIKTVHSPCEGPKIPNDLSSMPPVPENPEF